MDLSNAVVKLVSCSSFVLVKGCDKQNWGQEAAVPHQSGAHLFVRGDQVRVA